MCPQDPIFGLLCALSLYERQIMNFTPKTFVGTLVSGILTIAVVGLNGPAQQVAPAPGPIIAMQEAHGEQQSLQAGNPVAIIPAVEFTSASRLETGRPEYYQPVTHWYKNKHWWKRNAPIIGGAAGGGLIGGLAGGGKGALIGGAAGGGGGYLYKRVHHHHSEERAHRTHRSNVSGASRAQQ
jgi:hypothetical protein